MPRQLTTTQVPITKGKFLNLPTQDGFLNAVINGESTQASIPTPDAPVPIVSTTGNVGVRSDTKNMVTVTRSTLTLAGITYTNNGDGTITMNGTASGNSVYVTNASVAAYIRIIAGTTYFINGMPTSGSGGTYYVEAQTFNDDATTSYNGAFNTFGNFFTAAKTGWAYFYIATKTGFVASNLVVKPQLEVSAVATTFEKQITSTQTLPLGTTQLRSLPNDVSDRIYKSGGTWYLEQNVAREFFDGSESWLVVTGFDASYYRFLRYSPTNHLSNTGMNNRFTNRGGTAHGAYEYVYNLASSNSFYIQILASRLTANTVVALQTWLASNNVESLYGFPTPITTTITDPTLITALENIRTYQGITNITASTPVSGSYGRGRQLATNRTIPTKSRQPIGNDRQLIT